MQSDLKIERNRQFAIWCMRTSLVLFLLTMVHWIILDFPLRSIAICIGIDAFFFFLWDPTSSWYYVVSFALYLITVVLVLFLIVHYEERIRVYDEKLEKFVIPEFIDNRPFKEKSFGQRDAVLAVMLRNVNTKFVSETKIKYTFKNTEQLVNFHDTLIAGFLKRYLETYKDLPLEDIQGWDRMLLVAKNVQDEDLKDVYGNLVSSDIVHKYSNIRPAIRGNGMLRPKNL